jgi:hypothetical protein
MDDKLNSNCLELNSIPRNASATRFQVNLVNHNANGEKETGEDCDTFNENETEIVPKRRTSRLQSLKSSFKSSDKQKKETAARFKVRLTYFKPSGKIDDLWSPETVIKILTFNSKQIYSNMGLKGNKE